MSRFGAKEARGASEEEEEEEEEKRSAAVAVAPPRKLGRGSSATFQFPIAQSASLAGQRARRAPNWPEPASGGARAAH